VDVLIMDDFIMDDFIMDDFIMDDFIMDVLIMDVLIMDTRFMRDLRMEDRGGSDPLEARAALRAGELRTGPRTTPERPESTPRFRMTEQERRAQRQDLRADALLRPQMRARSADRGCEARNGRSCRDRCDTAPEQGRHDKCQQAAARARLAVADPGARDGDMRRAPSARVDALAETAAPDRPADAAAREIHPEWPEAKRSTEVPAHQIPRVPFT
jgi:hypothetical protein